MLFAIIAMQLLGCLGIYLCGRAAGIRDERARYPTSATIVAGYKADLARAENELETIRELLAEDGIEAAPDDCEGRTLAQVETLRQMVRCRETHG